ncbi:MAG: phosphoribosylformylglycinamidine cyclo-ligase [Planctomycetota bacterium]|jgi:phosphoribosylformylglycinamidine cyclo-ligase
MTSETYKAAGVDIDAGNKAVKKIRQHVKRTFDHRVIDFPGGFGGLYALESSAKLFRRNYRNPVLVACTDGVGTKLKIAFALDRHDTIGIDLVAMSVNDLIVQGAEPRFFLDYIATGKLRPGVIEEIVKGISDACVESKCAILGGEMAELPGFYQEGEYDLAGFALGIVERSRIIRGTTVEAGDVVIGFPSSGLHSNGYSLARRVLIEKTGWKLSKHVEDFGRTLGEEMLEPTKIYVQPVVHLIKTYQKKIVRAVAHITGGGLIENLPRVLPRGLGANLNQKTWDIPPVFQVIQKLGKVKRDEMYRVFNMGIGMAIIVPPYNGQKVIRRLKKFKIKARQIGRVIRHRGSGPRVTIKE